MKEMASDEGDVKACMIVSAPGTMAHAATTDTPYLGRSLGLSVGWETAVNSIVGVDVLSVKAAFGGVAFVDVKHMKAMANEKATKA